MKTFEPNKNLKYYRYMQSVCSGDGWQDLDGLDRAFWQSNGKWTFCNWKRWVKILNIKIGNIIKAKNLELISNLGLPYRLDGIYSIANILLRVILNAGRLDEIAVVSSGTDFCPTARSYLLRLLQMYEYNINNIKIIIIKYMYLRTQRHRNEEILHYFGNLADRRHDTDPLINPQVCEIGRRLYANAVLC